MSDKDLSHYIPRRLDAAGKFLFWDLDVAAIAGAGMLLGLAMEYQLLGVALGVALAYFYSKFKTGKHPGMAAHLAYWWIGLPQPRELPASHLRELNG